MALWLQYVVIGVLMAGALTYLAWAWGLVPKKRKKGACGCAKCPAASSMLEQISRIEPSSRRSLPLDTLKR